MHKTQYPHVRLSRGAKAADPGRPGLPKTWAEADAYLGAREQHHFRNLTCRMYRRKGGEIAVQFDGRDLLAYQPDGVTVRLYLGPDYPGGKHGRRRVSTFSHLFCWREGKVWYVETCGGVVPVIAGVIDAINQRVFNGPYFYGEGGVVRPVVGEGGSNKGQPIGTTPGSTPG